VLNTLVRDSALQVANNTTEPIPEKAETPKENIVENTNKFTTLRSSTSSQTDKDFQVNMLAQMKRTNELLQKQNRHLESLFSA